MVAISVHQYVTGCGNKVFINCLIGEETQAGVPDRLCVFCKKKVEKKTVSEQFVPPTSRGNIILCVKRVAAPGRSVLVISLQLWVARV